MCDGANKFLYPIHRNGVGACTSSCPIREIASKVNGFDVDDKRKMVCMSRSDFLEYTEADSEEGFDGYDMLNPLDAYKYGVCNYKYRTFQVMCFHVKRGTFFR